jgi:pimeloyl-ACP methyl ester carboxylesterase
MNDDAVSVMRYLTDTRHIPASHLVVFGEGLGSMPALHAANTAPGVTAIILDNPRMSQLSVFQSDPRTKILPLKLLVRDDFSLEDELAQFKATKLIIASIGTQQSSSDAHAVFAAAGDPKTFLDLPVTDTVSGQFSESVERFLDESFGLNAATPSSQGSVPAPVQPPEK